MSLVVSAKSGVNYDPIPEGTHLAVCNMLIDLGMQYNERYKNSSHKILIGWEFPDLAVVVDGEERAKTKSNFYTASLNEGSNLRRDLSAWRGRDFTEEELEEFNLNNILGKSCLLNIIHKDFNGKTIAVIQSIMALPKSMPKGQLSTPPVTFDFDLDPISKISTLPDWVQKIVTASETYAEKINQQADTAAQSPLEFPEADDNEEIPF